VCGLHLRLTKPQWQHVLRLADALIVSEARHKTIASLYRLMVEAPDPSNGADSLRISPWTAADLRAPVRHFTVADLVTYAHAAQEWTLYVSLDDSLGEKDKGTRHLEAVAYHHDHTKSQGKKHPYYTNGTVHIEVRIQLGVRAYAYDWRLYLREKTVRCLNRHRAPEQRLRFRKKTSLARDMLAGLQQLLPAGFQVYVLFDSWYASNGILKFCRRQGWHVICAIKSNRKLDDKKLSQWPQALRHQRYQRVQLTATDQRSRTYLVRARRGKLSKVPFEVCVLISQRHHRDKHPKYFLCTDLALSAQQILPIYQKRWPIEVDNFYVKQHLGLADFRVQSYLDNVTLNEWSAGPSQTVLLYVPGGVAPILNDGGKALHGANLRVAFGKIPNAQRLFGGCSHGTIPRVDLGGEPRRDWTTVGGRAWASTAGAGRAGRGL
jgi:hypothetical protein